MKASGHNLRVCGQEKGVRPELVERVRLMLGAVLKPVAKKGSLWVYIMTGPSEVLKHTSQYHLEMEPGSERSPRMVHVTMRASLLPDGSVHGMLQLPEDVPRDKFINAVTPIIATLNHAGWSGVLLHEQREQAFDVGRPALVTPLRQAMRGAGRSEDDDQQPPPRVTKTVDGITMIQQLRAEALARGQLDPPVRPAPRPKSPSAVASAPPRREASLQRTNVATSEVVPRNFPATRSGHAPAQTRKEAEMPTETHEDKLVRFLSKLLTQPSVNNGTFSGKGIVEIAQPIFPEQKHGWHRRGALFELEKLGWIRVVGHGEYQVEQGFVAQHHPGMTIMPRAKVSQVTQFKGSKPNGHAREPESFQSLLEQRTALDQRIRDQALSEQKRRQDAIEVLRVHLAEAEAELVNFNVEHAGLLPPVSQASRP